MAQKRFILLFFGAAAAPVPVPVQFFCHCLTCEHAISLIGHLH